MSAIEDRLCLFIRGAGLPDPEREVPVCPGRAWRFDIAWPQLRWAVEIEGGTWVKGRHGTGVGMAADAEKYNTAVLLGWRILRFTTDQIRDGRALPYIEAALGKRSVETLQADREAEIAHRRSAAARLAWQIRKAKEEESKR